MSHQLDHKSAGPGIDPVAVVRCLATLSALQASERPPDFRRGICNERGTGRVFDWLLGVLTLPNLPVWFKRTLGYVCQNGILVAQIKMHHPR